MPDQRVGAALRRVVQARARDLCEYCRCPAQFATQSFTVEHIVPRDDFASDGCAIGERAVPSG
jgi:hypothetical protein